MEDYDQGYSQALHDILVFVATGGEEIGLFDHALKVSDKFIAETREKYDLD